MTVVRFYEDEDEYGDDLGVVVGVGYLFVIPLVIMPTIYFIARHRTLIPGIANAYHHLSSALWNLATTTWQKLVSTVSLPPPAVEERPRRSSLSRRRKNSLGDHDSPRSILTSKEWYLQIGNHPSAGSLSMRQAPLNSRDTPIQVIVQPLQGISGGPEPVPVLGTMRPLHAVQAQLQELQYALSEQLNDPQRLHNQASPIRCACEGDINYCQRLEYQCDHIAGELEKTKQALAQTTAMNDGKVKGLSSRNAQLQAAVNNLTLQQTGFQREAQSDEIRVVETMVPADMREQAIADVRAEVEEEKQRLRMHFKKKVAEHASTVREPMKAELDGMKQELQQLSNKHEKVIRMHKHQTEALKIAKAAGAAAKQTQMLYEDCQRNWQETLDAKCKLEKRVVEVSKLSDERHNRIVELEERVRALQRLRTWPR